MKYVDLQGDLKKSSKNNLNIFKYIHNIKNLFFVRFLQLLYNEMEILYTL